LRECKAAIAEEEKKVNNNLLDKNCHKKRACNIWIYDTVYSRISRGTLRWPVWGQQRKSWHEICFKNFFQFQRVYQFETETNSK